MKSDSVLRKDKQLISPSYTRSYPFVIDRGMGWHLWDVDGKSYLDFTSGVAVANIGHSNPDVVKAIKEQVDKLSHAATTDFYNELIVDVAEKLQDITPGSFKKRVFFTNSGTESNECALKLARWKTKKTRIISFIGAFHGRTYGSMSMSCASSLHKEHFGPLVPGITHIPYPHQYRPAFGNEKTCGDDTLAYLEEDVLGKVIPSSEVAAVIIEPVQGEEGYIVPPKDFLKKLQRMCRKHNFLLIADEIQTGFGRSGKWFASDVFGVEPDIITVAKAIASGIPMGACVARQNIMDWPRGAHASTFSGNPLACAASIATINYMKRNKVWKNAETLGKHGLSFLSDLQEDFNRKHNRKFYIGDVRGLGLMLAVEFVKNRETKEYARKEAEKVLHTSFKNGLLMLHAGQSVVRLIPPLVINKEDFNKGLHMLTDVLKKM
ncbi:MAG: acetyl ornithine aminotransferase family protein [Candidatus Aenigmatarchaeota archaeon]